MVRMGGNFGSIAAMVAMGTVVVAQNQGCVDGTAMDDTGGISNSEALQSYLEGVGPNVVLPALDRYISAVKALEASLVLHSDELAAGSDGAATKVDVQADWLDAMASWQEVEVMQVGPAGSSLRAISGQDVRDEIYSWPTVNGCRVDQRTADGSWTDATFYEQNLVNAYGMDALEHLLFASPTSECPSQVVPISDGSWDALRRSWCGSKSR